jgi:hypothetical protein
LAKWSELEGESFKALLEFERRLKVVSLKILSSFACKKCNQPVALTGVKWFSLNGTESIRKEDDTFCKSFLLSCLEVKPTMLKEVLSAVGFVERLGTLDTKVAESCRCEGMVVAKGSKPNDDIVLTPFFKFAEERKSQGSKVLQNWKYNQLRTKRMGFHCTQHEGSAKWNRETLLRNVSKYNNNGGLIYSRKYRMLMHCDEITRKGETYVNIIHEWRSTDTVVQRWYSGTVVQFS